MNMINCILLVLFLLASYLLLHLIIKHFVNIFYNNYVISIYLYKYIYINITNFALISKLEKDHSMIETRRLKNAVIVFQIMIFLFATLFLQYNCCEIRSKTKRPDLDAIFKYFVRISANNITFADVKEKVENSCVRNPSAEGGIFTSHPPNVFA